MELSTRTSPSSPCVAAIVPMLANLDERITSADDVDLDVVAVGASGSTSKGTDGLDDPAVAADHLADVVPRQGHDVAHRLSLVDTLDRDRVGLIDERCDEVADQAFGVSVGACHRDLLGSFVGGRLFGVGLSSGLLSLGGLSSSLLSLSGLSGGLLGSLLLGGGLLDGLL